MLKNPKMAAVSILASALLAPVVLAASFSIPKSNRVVKGKINLASGVAAEYGVREGVMITVEEPGREKLGLIPTISDNSKGARFAAFRLVSDGDGQEKVVYIPGSIEVGIGDESLVVVEKIRVGVVEVHEEKFPTQPNLSGRPGELEKIYGDEKCCLVCDDTRLCASSIKMSCGRCSKY